MKLSKKILCLAAASTMLLASSGCGKGCEHENILNATCLRPKTCFDCGETWGESLDHTTHTGQCDICHEFIVDGADLPTFDYVIKLVLVSRLDEKIAPDHKISESIYEDKKNFVIFAWLPDEKRFNKGEIDYDYVLEYYDSSDIGGILKKLIYRIYTVPGDKNMRLSAVNKYYTELYGPSNEKNDEEGSVGGYIWHDDKNILTLKTGLYGNDLLISVRVDQRAYESFVKNFGKG